MARQRLIRELAEEREQSISVTTQYPRFLVGPGSQIFGGYLFSSGFIGCTGGSLYSAAGSVSVARSVSAHLPANTILKNMYSAPIASAPPLGSNNVPFSGVNSVDSNGLDAVQAQLAIITKSVTLLS